jgi:small subunit ribosomal protein S8|tara:strand:+ start:6326 stop:6724 length:399 start_codon:yes stop_codon:yes gene_type:complete
MVNDTISDLLTRIRNANIAKHHLVEVPSTKMTKNIIKILKEEGYIEDFQFLKEGIEASIVISLKYVGKERRAVITKLERVSKPGIRVYTNSKNIPDVLGKLGIGIISTSQGIMTTSDAKNLKIGGEFLCKIY